MGACRTQGKLRHAQAKGIRICMLDCFMRIYSAQFVVASQDDKNTAVVLANPISQEFDVVRTALLPSLLKTMGNNKV